MFKKALMGCGGLFILLIVIIVIAGVANSGNNSPHKVSNASTTTPTPTQQADFKVGDTIAIKDQTLKVNSVNANYIPSNEFEQAAAGHQLVLVNVTLHNNSSSSVDYNVFDFKIQDASGNQTSETISASSANALSSGSLAQSGTVTGNIVFDVTTANASKLKLLFQPSFWDSQTATVDLN